VLLAARHLRRIAYPVIVQKCYELLNVASFEREEV
jgi:hypothetical protein